MFRDFVLVSKMGYTGSTCSAVVQRYSIDIVLIETSALSGNMSENSSQPALTPTAEVQAVGWLLKKPRLQDPLAD